jgi:hypothetical protein
MNKYSDEQIRTMIHNWLVKKNEENDDKPYENENYKGLAESCHYSIIENYVPDCPGWHGDILTVVFGHIDALYVFTVEDNKLLFEKKTARPPFMQF